MEGLKIDRTKLKTVKNYAISQGVSPQAIYKMIDEERIESTKIDGVVFIKI